MDPSEWRDSAGSPVLPSRREVPRWVWLVLVAVLVAMSGAAVRALAGPDGPAPPPPSGDTLGEGGAFVARTIPSSGPGVAVDLPEEWRLQPDGAYRPVPPGGVLEELRVSIERGAGALPPDASNTKVSDGRTVFTLPPQGQSLRAGVLVRSSRHAAVVILTYAEGGVIDDAGAAETILESAQVRD